MAIEPGDLEEYSGRSILIEASYEGSKVAGRMGVTLDPSSTLIIGLTVIIQRLKDQIDGKAEI